MMLYNKIEENQQLQKKMEQNQMQHTMFLTKLLLNNQGDGSDPNQMGSAGSPSQMQSQIQNQLQSYLQNQTTSNSAYQFGRGGDMMSNTNQAQCGDKSQLLQQQVMSCLGNNNSVANSTNVGSSQNPSPLIPNASQTIKNNMAGHDFNFNKNLVDQNKKNLYYNQQQKSSDMLNLHSPLLNKGANQQ